MADLYVADQRTFGVPMAVVNSYVNPDGSLNVSLEELTDVLISAVANKDILYWNAGASKWENTSLSGLAALTLEQLTDVLITGVADGDVVTWVAADSKWENKSAAFSFHRKTVTLTTASLADLATENDTIATMGRAFMLYNIETSHAAWVRFYDTVADRTADNGRIAGDPAVPGTGVLAEFLTTSDNQIVDCGPVPILDNGDSPGADAIYVSVVNRSGATNAITLTMIGTILEG